MDSYAIDELRGNFSAAEGDTGHLLRCWLQSGCDACLNEERCSWCPFTWSCVPNDYQIPFIAPVYEEQICPSAAERWELRTRPLGCHVSPITIYTGLGSSLVTFSIMVLAFLTVLAGVRVRVAMGRRETARRRRRRRQRLTGEQEPLIWSEG